MADLLVRLSKVFLRNSYWVCVNCFFKSKTLHCLPKGVSLWVLSINDLPGLREPTCLLHNRDNFIAHQLTFSTWEIFQKLCPMATVTGVFILQNDFFVLLLFWVAAASSVVLSGFQLSPFCFTIVPSLWTLFSPGLPTFLLLTVSAIYRATINRL